MQYGLHKLFGILRLKIYDIFSLHSEKDGPYPQDAIYYTYANADFSDVEIIPKRLFEYPYPTIDADIVLDEAGIYHLF